MYVPEVMPPYLPKWLALTLDDYPGWVHTLTYAADMGDSPCDVLYLKETYIRSVQAELLGVKMDDYAEINGYWLMDEQVMSYRHALISIIRQVSPAANRIQIHTYPNIGDIVVEFFYEFKSNLR